MTLGQPREGSKEGPSKEAVDAARDRKLATDKLTMAQWWSMAYNAGALFAGLERVQGGVVIALKGVVSGDECEHHRFIPDGEPFDVHARACLEGFREGDTNVEIVAPPMPETIHVEEIPTHARKTEPPADPVPPNIRHAHGDGGGHGSVTTKTTPNAPTAFKQHTSMIKKQDGTPQHRHVAGAKPPGAAGMCEQCKVQPVQHPGSKFCGGNCAKQWHMNKIAKQQGINLPRYK